MFVTNSKSRDIKTIRQGDPDFHLSDGIVLYPRAMIHITPDCPTRWREYIELAMAEGYIKCVAHVQGKELTWEQLSR